jgi:hypothetical protein
MKLRTEKVCIECVSKQGGEQIWDYLRSLGYKPYYNLSFRFKDYGLKTYIWVNWGDPLELHMADNNFHCNEISFTSSNINGIKKFFGSVENLSIAKIAIRVGESETLRKIIQDLYFAAGYKWFGESKDYSIFSGGKGDQYEEKLCLHGAEGLYLQYCNADYYRKIGFVILDAATQMGEIIDIFEGPKVKIPEIHGHKLESYVKKPFAVSSVTFGCATISIALLESVYSWMDSAGENCNRTIDSIKLSSGKELTKAQIKEILEYWNKQPSQNV